VGFLFFRHEREILMTRSLIRLVSMMLLAMAMLVPSGMSAQDATPTGAQPGLGGDLELGVSWLADQQLEDGSFAGFSGEADAGTTVDAVIALSAAQSSGVDTGDSINRAIEYLAGDGVAQAYAETGVGQASKLVLALVAVGEDPSDFGGIDALSIVTEGQNSESGVFGGGIYDHAYAMLALAATDSEVPENAITALEDTQTDLGGWAFDGSTDGLAADSNTTSMVIQALVATGNSDHSMLQGALEYLPTTLDDEGGAAYSPGSEADGNSTALVAQAYIATQGDATSLLAALQQFQLPSGAYFYQYADTTENLFTTVQAIPAVAGMALPVMPASVATPSASPVALFEQTAA
jgi:hypothetical protein